MKIEFTPKRIKLFKVAMALIAVSLTGYVAYAASTLTVNNTATINLAGVNLFLAPSQTPTTVCSVTTGTYSETPTIAWGSVTQLSTQDQYACLQNTGATAHTLVVSTSFAAADGTLNIYSGGTGTTPLNGASIASNGFILVHLNWVVSSTAPTGGRSFTVTIA